jgi:CheY-like chemotaxis protein
MSIHILIVDDSKAALFMFEKIIQLSGIDTGTIRKAENGLEALAVLETFPECNLILTDLNMPEMNGVQLLEQLKAKPLTRDIPVIVITTEGRDGFLFQAMERGASASLRKPSRPELVKSVILKTLGVEEDASHITDPYTGDY